MMVLVIIMDETIEETPTIVLLFKVKFTLNLHMIFEKRCEGICWLRPFSSLRLGKHQNFRMQASDASVPPYVT